MNKRDQRLELEALQRQAETPYAPHEGADGWVDLRQRCECGCNVGRVRLVIGQLTVRCGDCDRFHFNAPRALLGLPETPLKAVRIASRYNGVCKVCGAEHEIGHWVWWVPKTKGVMCAKCNESGGAK